MSEPTTTDTATVVLVHGAFADASSWNGVIERLQAQGRTRHGAGEPAARNRSRLRLHRRRPRADRRACARGRPLLRRRGDHERRDRREERRRPRLRGGLRPRRGRDPRRSRGGLEGQRPEQRARASAVPDRERRLGDGVLHRPGEGPRRVRGRPLRPAGRADRSHAAARRRGGVRRAERAARLEAPPVMGRRRHRRQGRRAPTSSARWPSVPAPRSPRSRART